MTLLFNVNDLHQMATAYRLCLKHLTLMVTYLISSVFTEMLLKTCNSG